MENKFAADPTSRVDGKMKVTGAAKYFAEFDAPKMSYCVLVTSTIARGTITSIDTKAAVNAPGVLAVYTHLNMPAIPGWDVAPNNNNLPMGKQRYRILGSGQVLFGGQPIAMAIADTYIDRYKSGRECAGCIGCIYAFKHAGYSGLGCGAE